MIKKTALYQKHIDLGGKIVEFAGWYLPVQYEKGIIFEHNTVRNGVGLFDVSHMGEFRAKGPKAFEFVQRCTSNDIATLFDGKVL